MSAQEADSFDEVIEDAAFLLPKQAILINFVHHNSWKMLQFMDFQKAQGRLVVGDTFAWALPTDSHRRQLAELDFSCYVHLLGEEAFCANCTDAPVQKLLLGSALRGGAGDSKNTRDAKHDAEQLRAGLAALIGAELSRGQSVRPFQGNDIYLI